jgi:hypothetical protein
MEKLEAALEKARLARKNAQIGVEEIASGPRIVKSPTSEAWSNLPEVTITPQQARNARIAALLGGKDATPYDMLRSRTIRMMKDSTGGGWRSPRRMRPVAKPRYRSIWRSVWRGRKDLKVLLMRSRPAAPCPAQGAGLSPGKVHARGSGRKRSIWRQLPSADGENLDRGDEQQRRPAIPPNFCTVSKAAWF